MWLLQSISALIIQLAAALLLWTAPALAQPVEYEGLLVPYEVIDIGAPTDGIVATVSVDRASVVTKGQVLVELEASVARAALEEAREKAAFTGDIKLEKARLAFAKRVHERVRPLAAVSEQDKDQAATEVILAGYRLEKAREKHTIAQIDYRRAAAILERHFIKSPVSGVVVERYVSSGEYVSNQPLLQVAQIDPLLVEVIVPAGMFGMITPGMTATVTPEFEKYGTLGARVIIVDRVVDSASSTFGVRLELPNPDQHIPSGLKCRVRFEVEGKADMNRNPDAKIESQAARDR